MSRATRLSAREAEIVSWFCPQPVHQRLDRVLPVRRFDRADLFVAHTPMLIDDEGLRHARNPEIDSSASTAVKPHPGIRVAILFRIFRAVGRCVFPVYVGNGNAPAA